MEIPRGGSIPGWFLRKELAALRAKFQEPVLWGSSYFVASAGGVPLSVIKRHIEQQATPL